MKCFTHCGVTAKCQNQHQLLPRQRSTHTHTPCRQCPFVGTSKWIPQDTCSIGSVHKLVGGDWQTQDFTLVFYISVGFLYFRFSILVLGFLYFSASYKMTQVTFLKIIYIYIYIYILELLINKIILFTANLRKKKCLGLSVLRKRACVIPMVTTHANFYDTFLVPWFCMSVITSDVVNEMRQPITHSDTNPCSDGDPDWAVKSGPIWQPCPPCCWWPPWSWLLSVSGEKKCLKSHKGTPPAFGSVECSVSLGEWQNHRIIPLVF